MRFSAVHLATAFTALIFMTGCAGVGVPEVPGSAAATSPALATTPTPVAVAPQAPEQTFGGDCAGLFSDAEVTTALGSAVERSPEVADDIPAAAVADVGGLECVWSPSNDGPAALVDIVVSPVNRQTHDDEVYCYGVDAADSSEGGACRGSVTVGDYWMTSQIRTAPGTTNDDTRVAAAALVALFRTRAGTPAPGPQVTARGTWSGRTDCAALSEASGVAAEIGSPSLVATESDVAGGELPEGLYSAIANAGVFACNWSQVSETPAGQLDGFGIVGLPGGAWAKDNIAALPGAEIIDIDSVESAIRVPSPGGSGYTVNAFDGVNWLQLGVADSDTDAAEVARAVSVLVAALGASAG